LRTVSPTEHAQKLALRDRAECPVCGKTFMGGAVVREDQAPITGAPLNGYLGACTLLTLHCDHCDHLVTQLHAMEGGRVGQPIAEYGLIPSNTPRGRRTIDKFLTEHPEAKGVAQ